MYMLNLYGKQLIIVVEEYIVVDGHIHTFSSDEVAEKIITSFNLLYDIQFVNPGNGTIDDVLRNMSLEGIDYSVMANFAPPKIIHNNNKWTLKTAREHDRLIPLVSFHPEMEGCMVSLLEEYIREGARGIKFHPMAQGFYPNDEKLGALYEFCNDISFPIVFHCGRVSNARLNEFSDVDMILPVIEKYGNIPFVLTHMADGNVKDVLRVSQNYGNVFFDTSIVITGYESIRNCNEPSWLDDDMVVEVINSIGSDRVIFGSDYPWGSPGPDIRRLVGLNLDKKQKKQIFGENALKIFHKEIG